MSIVLIGIHSYVPQFAKTIFIMVGAMAAPLFMLILGGNLYQDLMVKAQGKRKIYFAEVITFVLAKNILLPLVALGILIMIKPAFPLALIIMLEATVPPITSIPIFPNDRVETAPCPVSSSWEVFCFLLFRFFRQAQRQASPAV